MFDHHLGQGISLIGIIIDLHHRCKQAFAMENFQLSSIVFWSFYSLSDNHRIYPRNLFNYLSFLRGLPLRLNLDILQHSSLIDILPSGHMCRSGFSGLFHTGLRSCSSHESSNLYRPISQNHIQNWFGMGRHTQETWHIDSSSNTLTSIRKCNRNNPSLTFNL